jgi:N-acetylglucosamine-6-phosphate deacetylase
MRFMLRGARLVDASTDLPAGDVIVEDGTLTAAGASLTSANSTNGAGEAIDASDMIVTPGFIDIHTHGGGGFNLHTNDADEILAFAQWAPSTGLTSFLIAVVGVPDALPTDQLRAAVAACERVASAPTRATPCAEPLGIFLEGPYISAARRGAHMASWLRRPNLDEVNEILALAEGQLRLITLAPELPGAEPVIHRLVEAGVTVSVGHSDASYEQTLEAFRLGVSHATHCCNAMRPLYHRDPGPLGALAESPRVMGELIADGVHVHPAMAQIVEKILGPERTIIITDAQPAAGMEGATFTFAGQSAHIERGAARLADGTITGSVLTMDQALRNTLAMTRTSLSEAVGMLTLNPAHAIHFDQRKGLLASGYDADLLVLSDDLTLQATYCRGALAYATETWRKRLDMR